MAGDLDNTQFKTNDEVEEWFYRATIQPELQAIQDTLNLEVLPRLAWYQGEYFEFDTSTYDKVTEADKATQDLIEQRYKAGVLDFYTFAQLSDSPVSEEFKGWRWNDKASAPMPPDKWKIGWQFGLVAGSVYNSELFTGEPLPQPVDPTLVTPDNTGGEPVADAQTQAQVDGQPVPGINPALPVAPLDPTKDLGEPLFVGLSFANNPELVDLQRRVMTLHNDPTIQWNKPEDYHATLLYAPAVDSETARAFNEALQEYSPPDLTLRIGQLNTFDNVGEHALHFRVRSNTALKEYQSAIYDLASEYGIQCSQHSNPAGYTPHITLGYLPEKTPRLTYDGKVKVTPRGVWCDYGEDTLWQSWVVDTPPDDEPPAGGASPTKAALPELDHLLTADQLSEWTAWRKFIKSRAGKSSIRDFDFKVTPEGVALYANAALKYGIAPEFIIPATHEHYARLLAAKALSTTQAAFDTALVSLFKKDIRKPVFISRMDALLTRYCRLAMLDGFTDGGIEDADLDDTEDEDMVAASKWLDNFIGEQRAYVQGVADKLFSDDSISDEEIEQNKPLMWFNLSVKPAYNHALVNASGNGLGLFTAVKGGSEDSCIDCEALLGQKRRFSTWNKYFSGTLPPCDKTFCKGFRCVHGIIPTTGKKDRGALPRLHGS